jgi:hypothetical protein
MVEIVKTNGIEPIKIDVWSNPRKKNYSQTVELEDAPASKAGAKAIAGSSPASGTNHGSDSSMNYSRQTLKGYDVSFVLHRGETSTAPHLGQFLPRRFIHPHEQDTTISFLDATGPLHHHRNRYAVTGGALRHLLVDY